MNNTYFILRHGQTSYQLEKEEVLYPWPEPSPILLTEEGRERIKVAAKELKKERVDLIYSSDIPRARQTAEIVAQVVGAKAIFDGRLREVDFGIYRGRFGKEFKKFFSDSKEKFFKRPPEGESSNDVKKRMLNFLKEVDKKHKGKNILIISHGDPLWLLVGAVKGLEPEEMIAKKHPELFLEVGEFRKLI